jgi:hypothetical protein
MGNYSYLLARPSADVNRRYESSDILVEAKNGIPPFWYTLFGPEDRCWRTEAWEDADGKAVTQVIPCLLTTRDLALRRLEGRRDLLTRAIPPETRYLLDGWARYVRARWKRAT